MSLQKKDFIEVEFTAKTKDGEIFDTNIAENLRKANLEGEAKPFAYCLGEDMFLKSVDDFLIGKEIGSYKIELKPEQAFGKRESSLVQIIPIKIFFEHKINPIPGAVLNFDGKLGKVLTVTGGRVMIDFNSPLAGKEVIYDIKVLRKIDDLNEKINAFNFFLFRKEFKFNIESDKLILETESAMKKFVELFKEKYKNIFNLDLVLKEIKEEKRDDKKSEDIN